MIDAVATQTQTFTIPLKSDAKVATLTLNGASHDQFDDLGWEQTCS